MKPQHMILWIWWNMIGQYIDTEEIQQLIVWILMKYNT